MSDPELIREIGRCMSLDMGKPTYLQKGQEPLFGRGVLKANGAEWHRQRKLIAPEFYMAKVKVCNATPRSPPVSCHPIHRRTDLRIRLSPFVAGHGGADGGRGAAAAGVVGG